MNGGVVDDGRLLELLDGATIVPGLIVLAYLTRYLWREAKRRKLRGFDWIHFPPGMNLVLSMFIFSAAVVAEKITRWSWRLFDTAGVLAAAQTIALFVFGNLIIAGMLCKLRALTYPDQGNAPWVISAVLSGAAILALLVFT